MHGRCVAYHFYDHSTYSFHHGKVNYIKKTEAGAYRDCKEPMKRLGEGSGILQ